MDKFIFRIIEAFVVKLLVGHSDEIIGLLKRLEAAASGSNEKLDTVILEAINWLKAHA